MTLMDTLEHLWTIEYIFVWTLVVICGQFFYHSDLYTDVDTYGYLWTLADTIGHQRHLWTLTHNHGHLWTFIDICGHFLTFEYFEYFNILNI